MSWRNLSDLNFLELITLAGYIVWLFGYVVGSYYFYKIYIKKTK